jgi:hypothetical protein
MQRVKNGGIELHNADYPLSALDDNGTAYSEDQISFMRQNWHALRNGSATGGFVMRGESPPYPPSRVSTMLD